MNRPKGPFGWKTCVGFVPSTSCHPMGKLSLAWWKLSLAGWPAERWSISKMFLNFLMSDGFPTLPEPVNNRASCASEDKASEVREKESSVRGKEEQKKARPKPTDHCCPAELPREGEQHRCDEALSRIQELQSSSRSVPRATWMWVGWWGGVGESGWNFERCCD